MIVNDVVTGAAAILIAYLLGSIPAAYIITRLITGKDIRQLGGGNAGTRNVFQEIGKRAGISVGLFDLAKGVAAVLIAYRLLNVPLFEPQLLQPFIPLAALAAVVGHIWSVYLKFSRGERTGHQPRRYHHFDAQGNTDCPGANTDALADYS